MTFKGIAAKLVAASKSFKSEILKAAEEAPVIANDIEKDAPEVAELVELAFPGAAAFEEMGVEAVEVIADAVEALGPAAADNGLSVSFDKDLIAKVRAALPALKAFAAKL